MKWAWPFRIRNRGIKYNEEKSSGRIAGPDFLCVGAHKAGSTWLYQQLDSHPDFWMPPVKELHYFDQLSRVHRAGRPRRRDERDSRFLEQLEKLSAEPGINLKNYGRLFESTTSLLSGDISPNYSTLGDEVIGQIAGYFPNIKVIYLARDPVERLWSHLSMEVHYGQIQPFDPTDINEVDRNLSRRGMLLRSYPSTVVARWKRHVHAKQFRVYFFDDLQSDPAALRRSIVRFLGGDPDKFATANPSCGGPGARLTADYNSWNRMERLPLTNEVRSHLAQFFKKELKTCATQLGGPARNWPARYGL